jgi:hypothetical protein
MSQSPSSQRALRIHIGFFGGVHVDGIQTYIDTFYEQLNNPCLFNRKQLVPQGIESLQCLPPPRIPAVRR